MNKLYSFDLFDTLITRELNHPHDVFLCIEATGKPIYRSIFFKLLPFSKLRVFSEKVVRKLTRKEDVTIYQIYKFIGIFLKNSNEMRELELDIELKVLYPIHENINFLNRLIADGNKVCITSDMYLTKNNIFKILKKNNIYVDDVYVSSDIGLTKASGNLFKYIANQQNIDLKDIVHYGDNLHSDIQVPSDLGVKVIHVGSPKLVKSYNIFDIFKFEGDALSNVGVRLAGPMAYAFAFHINKYSKFNTIVFGARDSYIFKKAYDLFFNNKKTLYTRISRGLVYLPSIFYTKNKSYLLEGGITCDEFFQRINIECPDVFKNKNFHPFAKDIDEYLRKINFLENLNNKAKEISLYLEKNGFSNNVEFVDLGWRGSIQDSLKTIFPDINIRGFYIGVLNNSEDKNGFLFSGRHPSSTYFHIMQSIGYFEFIFTEPTRSIKDVYCINGNYNYIYTDDEDEKQIKIREKFRIGSEIFFHKFAKLDIEIEEKYLVKSIKKSIKKHMMFIDENVVTELKSCSHSAGFNGSLKSSLIGFNDFSIIGYLTAPWKAYYMYELRKSSILKYYLYLIIFHNIVFFSFYEQFKILFRKVRMLIRG